MILRSVLFGLTAVLATGGTTPAPAQSGGQTEAAALARYQSMTTVGTARCRSGDAGEIVVCRRRQNEYRVPSDDSLVPGSARASSADRSGLVGGRAGCGAGASVSAGAGCSRGWDIMNAIRVIAGESPPQTDQ